jgi:hypothetical protein
MANFMMAVRIRLKAVRNVMVVSVKWSVGSRNIQVAIPYFTFLTSIILSSCFPSNLNFLSSQHKHHLLLTSPHFGRMKGRTRKSNIE